MRRPAVLLAVLLLAGCGGGGAPSGALSEHELGWVRSFVHWRTGFDERARAVQGAVEGGLQPDIGPIVSCGTSFRREVGAPPTKRLRRPERLMLAACAAYARGEREEASFYAGSIASGMRAQSHLSKASETSLRAFDALDALAWDGRRLPRTARASSRPRLQPFYAEIAQRITSRAAQVRCWDDAGWRRVLREAAAFQDSTTVDADGYANFLSGRMNLSPGVCGALDDLVYRDKRPRDGQAADDTAYAVLVLAHESEHLAGVDDEALATCNGMQHIEPTARLLGVGAGYARFLALDYVRNVYRLEPDGYRSPACVEDGPLDLSPDDGRWP